MPNPTEIMQQALSLARLGRGMVEPNPMVGCVIVKDGRVIGQGYHQRFGEPHAEANALAACTSSPAGAAAYVTLEPCCHTGKKTPPCAPRLIEAGIASVIIACHDPNPVVSGAGASQLRAAGLKVATGLLEAEAKQLNAAFFANIVEHRPYVTLKWAQTADGKVAGPGGRRLAITGAAANATVHRLRARTDAILVGRHTVEVDDPLLTARDVPFARPLVRVVLDTHLRIPIESRLVRTARQGPVLVYCSRQYRDAPAVSALISRGVDVGFVDVDGTGQLDLGSVLADLHQRQVAHLLVEGGPAVAGSFLAANLVDRLWVFRSPRLAGSDRTPDAPKADYPSTGHWQIGDDLLVEMLNPGSKVFFALLPSADTMGGWPQ